MLTTGTTALLLAALCGILTALVVWHFIVRPGVLRSRWAKQVRKVTSPAPVEEAVVDERSLRGRLRGVGVDWGERTEMNFHLISVVLAVAGAVAAYAAGVPPVLVLLVAVAGFLLPRWWLNQQEGRIRRRLEEELKTGVGVLITTLRIQPDVSETLKIVRDLFQRVNPQSPLARHVDQVLREETRLASRPGGAGREKAIVQALRQVRESSPSRALNFVCFALSVYADVGGDFIDVLAAQQESIQDYLSARDEADTEATQFRGVFKIMPVMLAGGVVYMSVMQPGYAAFYGTFLGQVLLVAAAAWMVIGYFVANNIIDEVGA